MVIAALALVAQASLSIAATYEVPSAVSGDVAFHFRIHDVRVGALVDIATAPVVDSFAQLRIRPLATLDVAAHEDEHVAIFVGGAAGPTIYALVSVPQVNFGAGLALLATLDIATPISNLFTFDFIVRGGLELPLTIATQAYAIGQFGIGLTWKL